MSYTDSSGEVLGIKGFKDSKHYEQVRPVYPKDGVQLLMEKLGLIGEKRDKTTQLTVLELGAGTGKFTRVMAEVLRDANVRIIASDPVKEMCEQFKQMQPDIEIRQFGAENIDLPNESIDVVMAATSFHWFCYQEKAFLEIYRVLSPNGMLGVTWLYPDKESQLFIKKILEYVLPFYPQNPCMCITYAEEDVVKQITLSKKFSPPVESLPFITQWKCDREQCYQTTLSWSAVQTMSRDERSAFAEFVKKAMEDHVLETGQEITSLAYKMTFYWSKKIRIA